MKIVIQLLLVIGLIWSGHAFAFDPIKSAVSAAPESVSANATVVDWEMNVLREGSNGWTCLPDNVNAPGNAPVSNSDPFATEPTGKDNDWVTDLGAHLMVLVPDRESLQGMSTNHLNGGPWVMWPDTPYAHLMIPVVNRTEM